MRLDEIGYEDGVVRVRRDFAQRPHVGRFVFFAARAAREGERHVVDPCRTELR